MTTNPVKRIELCSENNKTETVSQKCERNLFLITLKYYLAFLLDNLVAKLRNNLCLVEILCHGSENS